MNTTNNPIEAEAIRDAIMKYYHEGHAKHDARYYAPILHPQWRFMLLNDDGDLVILDRDEYGSWYNPKDRDPDLDWKTEFYNIDVTDHNASVKLRIECQNVCYMDYFHMMKIDGTWWIVNKLSVRCPSSE
jgi:hypothetical protein